MKRRTFLQRVGTVLTALGITEAGWLTLGDRYYHALAQPSPRKLALLIGINQYSQSPTLTGCLTDVELQRELLIHRFGFHPSDILPLTEQQATRNIIETAFVEHLIKQARPGDVVVFHFSGYGTRVPTGTTPETMQNALVPVDGTYFQQDGKFVNNLLEETLHLLLRSLPTDRITAVLDTSYNAPSSLVQGGLRIRSRPQLVQAQINPEELDFQKQLKPQDSGLSTGIPGVVLTAASNPNQMAGEALLSGFSAGLFTYALTQYLWEAAPATSIQVSLSQVATSVLSLGGKQQPALLSGKNDQSELLLGEHFLSQDTVGEGVVTGFEDDGKTAVLWLGGLPPHVLELYGVNSRLIPATNEGKSVQLQVRSRSGLIAKAQVMSADSTTSLQAGQLVREAVRVLPRNIGLTVALGGGLERIERVDATSAFSGIAHVTTAIAGEQPADYVFGKVREGKTQDLLGIASMAVSPSRYGLFSLGDELIPNTAGEAGEAVKMAVHRLGAKMQTLLAAKLWRLTANEGSSGLSVKASLEVIDGTSQVLMQRETLRTAALNSETSPQKLLNAEPQAIPTMPIGSRIQYRVQNMGDRPIYLMLLGLDSSRAAIALYPWQPTAELNNSQMNTLFKEVVIEPGETITVPQSSAGSEWVTHGPAFFCETQLIFSTSPFTQTLASLEFSRRLRAEQQRIGPLLNPLEVAQAMLQDLHNASGLKADINGAAADSYVLDVNNWAGLGFIYQVV